MSRECRYHWFAAALVGVMSVGCGVEESADPEPASVENDDAAAVRALEPYASTWQAAEPLYRDDAFVAVAEAVHERRPEYSVQELRESFAALVDVDYTALRVEGATITFSNATAVLCAGRYSPRTEHDHDHADAGAGSHSHEHQAQAFQLVATVDGDCSSYAALEISALETHGPNSHFHIVHGTASEPMRPAPWSPAVWPMDMTPAAFAELAMGAVSFFASSLPAK